ncbi:MAG: DUF1905 domain-containing protein [Sinimarinibacterium sp.]|jgi:hypothetical protein
MTRKPTPRRHRDPELADMERFSPLLDDEPTLSSSGTFTVEATVWRYTGAGGWHFANLPEALSAEIRAKYAKSPRGWGSIPVQIRIGETEWDTSLFLARKTRSYLFAIKASVRKDEGIVDGSRITAYVRIR